MCFDNRIQTILACTKQVEKNKMEDRSAACYLHLLSCWPTLRQCRAKVGEVGPALAQCWSLLLCVDFIVDHFQSCVTDDNPWESPQRIHLLTHRISTKAVSLQCTLNNIRNSRQTFYLQRAWKWTCVKRQFQTCKRIIISVELLYSLIWRLMRIFVSMDGWQGLTS